MNSGNRDQWHDNAPQGRGAGNEPSIIPWLNRPGGDGDAPTPGRFSDPTSRRRFLRAAVAAGAVVAGTGTVGGIVLANRKPGIVGSILAGSATPSGHCVPITASISSVPFTHVQVSTTDFTTWIGTIAQNGVFAIVHPYSVLVDSANANLVFNLCITGAQYKHNSTTQVVLTVKSRSTASPNITRECPAGSCLYVSHTRTCS